MIRVDRRLWLTADRDELVEDGDPRAAFLWAGAGREVAEAEAERLGYVPAGEAPAEPAEPEPAPATGEDEPAAGEDEPADLQWSLGDEPEAPAEPAEPEPKTRRRRS